MSTHSLDCNITSEKVQDTISSTSFSSITACPKTGLFHHHSWWQCYPHKGDLPASKGMQFGVEQDKVWIEVRKGDNFTLISCSIHVTACPCVHLDWISNIHKQWHTYNSPCFHCCRFWASCWMKVTVSIKFTAFLYCSVLKRRKIYCWHERCKQYIVQNASTYQKDWDLREKQCDQVNMLGCNMVQIPEVAHSFNLWKNIS